MRAAALVLLVCVSFARGQTCSFSAVQNVSAGSLFPPQPPGTQQASDKADMYTYLGGPSRTEPRGVLIYLGPQTAVSVFNLSDPLAPQVLDATNEVIPSFSFTSVARPGWFSDVAFHDVSAPSVIEAVVVASLVIVPGSPACALIAIRDNGTVSAFSNPVPGSASFLPLTYPLSATDGQFAYCTALQPTSNSGQSSNFQPPQPIIGNSTFVNATAPAANGTMLSTLGFSVSAGSVTALVADENLFSVTSAGGVPLSEPGVIVLYEAGLPDLYCFLQPPSSFGSSAYNALNLSAADTVLTLPSGRLVYRVDVRMEAAVPGVSQHIFVQGSDSTFSSYTVSIYEVDSACQFTNALSGSVSFSRKPRWWDDFFIGDPPLINPILTPSRGLNENGAFLDLNLFDLYQLVQFFGTIPSPVCGESYTYTDPDDYLEFQVTHPVDRKVTYRRFSRFRAPPGDAGGGGIAFEIAQRP